MYANAQSSSLERSMIDPASGLGIADSATGKEYTVMLYTIALVLVVLWLLGLVTSYTMGGFIHVLLVIAVIVILLRLISGRSIT
jgi:Family of unknown function (DUF5670)